MASPQLENGFTPIAHELFQAFYSCKMVEYERVIVMHLWRKTYGWGKKEDWISNSQFSEETGVPRPHVTRTLKALKEKKIVTQRGNKLSVNKNYNEWVVEWRKLPHQVTRVTSPGNEKLPHQVPTIERKIITKELGDKSPKRIHLKVNKNDMGWNSTSDDYEEGVVDYDNDGSLKGVEKKSTRKYPNAPVVRKLFQEILGTNPADWNKNVTVLQACENLFTERGVEKVRNALEFYSDNKDKEFCPVITSPVDLDRKYQKLSIFKNSL